MVKELLLGDNPFIGVSHLAQERARETLQGLSLERKAEVVKAATEAGATGFSFSAHPSNLELLRYLAKTDPHLLTKLNYYILVPYAAGYVREATKTGLSGLLKKIILSSLNLENANVLMPPTPSNAVKLFIEGELREYTKILPREKIKGVLLHEVLTELVVAFNLAEIVEALHKHFHRKGIGFGLETRNIKHTKEFLENNNLRVDYIMTPLNPLGYQMTPSKEAAEKAIQEISSKGVKTIAISILAAGAITPTAAVKYLASHAEHLYALCVATSKPHRARELLRALSTLCEYEL